MVFFVNKSTPSILDRIKLVGGDEEKVLLLVGDGVIFGTEFWEEQLEEMEVEEVFVAKDAVEARNLTLSDNCEVVDYDAMVDLLLDNDEKIISL